MRIGVDAKNLIGPRTGISRYIIEMCRELAKNGHQLFLYLPHAPQTDLPIIDHITYRIGQAYGALNRIYWSRIILPKLATKDEVDLFWGPAHRLPSKLRGSIPKLLTIHDLTWKYAPQTMYWRTRVGEILWMEKALDKADCIISVSQSTAKQIKQHYPQYTAKIDVISPGFSDATHHDGNHEDALILQELKLTGNYILFVGTLEPRKNLHRLLEAYAKLPETIRSQFPLVVAGGQGWRLKDLHLYISELHLSQNIILTGFVSDHVLSILYKNAYFLTMPSLYEGFGLPIIEAHSSGIPVLTSNGSSMPEVGGKASIYINPLSVTSIADGLCELIENKKLYQSLKDEAPANASKFQWKQSVEKFENIIQQRIFK